MYISGANPEYILHSPVLWTIIAICSARNELHIGRNVVNDVITYSNEFESSFIK